jgi:hypothetical protein
MPQRRPIRMKESTAVLAMLLLVGMLIASGVWHTHSGNSPETCQVCHLNHQPVAQHLIVGAISAPALVSIAPLPVDSGCFAGPSTLLTVSRAPPTA